MLFYGSTAKETNRPNSDLDLMIIVPLRAEKKYTCGEYSYKYHGREINIVLRSIEKLRIIANNLPDPFQSEVFRNCEIILANDSEVKKILNVL